MRCLLRFACLMFSSVLVTNLSAQLVAPPTLDWVSIPATATLGQPVSVGAGAHANLSDNSDGKEWNAIGYGPEDYDYDPYVVAFILIELQRPGESGWTTLCQWLSPWQTPAQNWASFTPTSIGTHYIRVLVMDGRPWYTPQYTYAIGVPNPTPSITSQLTVAANQGYTLSYTITATNNPTSFSASNLAAGLSLNSSTGVISGRVLPWTSTVNSTITATNGAGSDTQTLTWNITGAVITPNSSVSPTGITIGSTVTLTRAGSANFGIGWTESTIWKPNNTPEALGNLQLGSQNYTPSGGTGTYWYQVRIVDNSGYNYVDQWISFSVSSLPPPTGFQTTSVQAYSAAFSWSPVSGATGYNVYRNGVKLNGAAIGGTSFTDSSAQPSTTYTYTVKAIATDNSESPTSLNVTTAEAIIVFTPLP
jgi:hypothetical protein